MEVSIFPAGEPRRRQWVVSWRSVTMPAPVFEYYDRAEDALARANHLRTPGLQYRGCNCTVEPGDDFRLPWSCPKHGGGLFDNKGA